MTAIRAIKPISIAPTLTANIRPSVVPREMASRIIDPIFSYRNQQGYYSKGDWWYKADVLFSGREGCIRGD